MQQTSVLNDINFPDDNRKIFVLDTNILLHDPESIFRFEKHIVVITMQSIEELDSKKHDPIIGYNVREIYSKLERIFTIPYDRSKGISIPNKFDGILFFISDHLSKNFPHALKLDYVDNSIASITLFLKEKYPSKIVTLVTKDRNLALKGKILGIDVENYEYDKLTEENLTGIYDPLKSIVLDDKTINDIFSFGNRDHWEIPYARKFSLKYNEGVVVHDESGNFVGLAIRKDENIKILDYRALRVLGLGPKVLNEAQFSRNDEQAICIQQALDPDIKIQVIVGKAGTGKTHIAMAAALDQVFNQQRYKSIKLVKPVISKSRLGEDIGFLPGSVKRKIIPKMRPFMEKLKHFKNLDLINNGVDNLINEGIIELVNLADIRGSDLVESIVLFDEAQNASPFQIRTLGTRLGEKSKLIVLGDPTQIDNIYLDKYSNALVHLYRSAKKKPKPFIASVSLVQMVRSYTSEWFEENIDGLTKKSK